MGPCVPGAECEAHGDGPGGLKPAETQPSNQKCGSGAENGGNPGRRTWKTRPVSGDSGLFAVPVSLAPTPKHTAAQAPRAVKGVAIQFTG